MGLDISKFTNLISDLCSEVKCKFACCHDGVVMEFDNKDLAHQYSSVSQHEFHMKHITDEETDIPELLHKLPKDI